MTNSPKFLTAALLCSLSCSTMSDEYPELRGPYLGQPPPGSTPALFAPGFVCTSLNERDAALSPDGSIFVWSIWSGSFGSIVFSKFEDGVWTPPQMAPFSGRYSDLEPAFSPDGSRLYFASNRPLEGLGRPKDYDIWSVEVGASEWGVPSNVGQPVNTDANEFYPSIATNGAIYFTAQRQGSYGGEDIFRSERRGDAYTAPENIGPGVNTEHGEFNAFVAPDEHMILFSSFGRDDGQGGGDLYVSFRSEKGAWQPAVNLGETINTPSLEYCPSISPDGRYLFYSSRTTGRAPYWEKVRSFWALRDFLNAPLNGSGDIFWVEMSAVERLREVLSGP